MPEERKNVGEEKARVDSKSENDDVRIATRQRKGGEKKMTRIPNMMT